MTNRNLKLISVAVLSLVSVLIGFLNRPVPEAGSPNKGDVYNNVLSVSDGDTVVLNTGRSQEKVRLIGIDAPELGQRPWGKRSKEHLESLIGPGRTVKVEYDIERRDKYGRVLAYLRAADGQFLNEAMLADGYAVLFTFPPNVRYVAQFTKAERSARENRAGIWSKGGLKQSPVEYRKTHPRFN